jgi:hypothetical protein
MYEEICGKIVNPSGFLNLFFGYYRFWKLLNVLQLSESFRPTRIELQNTSSFQVN